MLQYLKFSIGNKRDGYKAVKVERTTDGVSYEILLSGLLSVEKSVCQKTGLDDWLNTWESLGVSSWDEIYTDTAKDYPEEWRLTVKEDDVTYKSGGSGAYPTEWNDFLDWLDSLMPEMEFIPADRIEGIVLSYKDLSDSNYAITENIRIDRKEKRITAEKYETWFDKGRSVRKSSHVYDVGDEIHDALDAVRLCDFTDSEYIGGEKPEISLTISYHTKPDLHVADILDWLDETGDEGWEKFVATTRLTLFDLKTKLLSDETYRKAIYGGKYIYCKVRFHSGSKLYSYRTDDSTLEVGDEVKVPVGRDNDIGYATIEEIDYYNEDDAPYPVDRTKFIIGRRYPKDE